MFDAVSWPHESLKDSHQDGVTEPWIAEAVCALVKAKGGHPVVLETGGFLGVTSAWLALTLERMGGGTLIIGEIDPDRAGTISDRLGDLSVPSVGWIVANRDVMDTIRLTADRSLDFVWVDDDHQKHHVESEIAALWPKMKPGGLLCFHDVWGVTDLQSLVKKWGGVALDFPRLGPAGGLGIIQVP